MKLDIPIISVNKIWQGRRFKTKAYKEWRALFCLLLKKHKKHEGKLRVDIEWGYNWANRTDIDNPIKPILDGLQEAGIIENDKDIWELNIKKVESKEAYIKINFKKL